MTVERAYATVEAFFDLGIHLKFDRLHPAKGGHPKAAKRPYMQGVYVWGLPLGRRNFLYLGLSMRPNLLEVEAAQRK